MDGEDVSCPGGVLGGPGVFVSVGDGTTSEGEFWESLNTASNGQLPVVYVIEDNGYAISVPVEVQTPGGDISRLVEGFPNLKVFRVDGTDLVASLETMEEAVAYARSGEGPAFVHAKVTRPYSHSLSDDERLYKTAEERARAAASVQARFDRILWQRLEERDGQLTAMVAGTRHRRPHQVRVGAAAALGLLDAGLPTVDRRVRSGS